MKVLIKLLIKHRYRHLITISKYEEVPDGLYGIEPLSTDLVLTKKRKYPVELSIDSFDLETKTAQIGHYKAIKLDDLGSLESVDELVEEMSLAGWDVSLNQDELEALRSPIERDHEKVASKSTEPEKPKISEWVASFLITLIAALVWFGYLADWRLESITYISAILVSFVGSSFWHFVALARYRYRARINSGSTQ